MKANMQRAMKHVKTPRRGMKRHRAADASVHSIQDPSKSKGHQASGSPAEPHSKATELHKMAIISVRELLKTDPYVPEDLSDSQIVEYLNCTNYDPEKCAAYMRGAFKMMKALPQLFTHRDVTLPEATQFWDIVNMAVFPKKSKEGYKIVYFGLQDPDPSHFHTVWGMKMYIISLEAIVRSGELVPAFVFILDGKGMCLGHIPISQLRFLKRAIGFLQECTLVNMKKIHFVNASSIVERSYSLLKPFFNTNVTESLFFYSDSKMLANVEEQAILPPELGGTLPGSIKLYKDYLRGIVESYAQYFKEDEDRRARKFNESKTSK